MINGKIWGSTELLLRTANVEIHHLIIKAGTVCSWHKHLHKFNAFYVNAGRLVIEVEKADYPLTDETVLAPGQMTTVAPGEFHRFRAETGVDALEVYYLGALAEDIVRRNVGGAIASQPSGRTTGRRAAAPSVRRRGRRS